MRYFLLLTLFLTLFNVEAQTSYNMSNTSATINCGVNNRFYDSGGAGSNYSNNQSFTKSFTSNFGTCLAFTFGAFNTEDCCDILAVYDGSSTSSPLIGAYSGTQSPGTIVSTGSVITFYFVSDNSVTRSGWTATITCPGACAGTPSPGTLSISNSTCSVNSGTVNLTVAGGTSVSCGLSYAWQTSTTNVGPWYTTPGLVTPSVSTSYVGNTYFRRVLTCGTSTAASNEVSVITGTPGPACTLADYTATAIAYSFDTFTGTTLPTTDDVLYTSTVSLGFQVCVGGVAFYGGYMASNCAFVFDAVPCFPNIAQNTNAAPGAATSYEIIKPAPTLSTSIPRNAILGPWIDIDPSLGGVVQYTTLGTAPNRRFVLSYENVPMYSCGTSSPAIYFTSQIKIFEQNDVIEIHVGNKGVCPGWNRGQAVLGLHSFDGKIYVPPVNSTTHNANVSTPGYTWTMTNTAYRFTAPCSSTVNCLTSLPVHFKSFYCDNNDAINFIYWETGSEGDLKEFRVERSEDGINFEVAGIVLANNVASKYVFEDKTYKHGITNYYRISSVEINGIINQTTIYPVLDKMEKLTVSEPYPNPSHGIINLSFSSKQTNLVYYNLKDLYGTEVLNGTYNVEPGVTVKNIDCRTLKNGIYLLELSDASHRTISQRKLFVMN